VLVLFGGGMAYAFKRLRPIFRERGEIQAQVTGRLAQALGGVRVVKAYVAEDREQQVFSSGVYRLFDNIRKTITGISATTAGATVIVGVVGVVMIVVGGQSILSGDMTLGDFIMYLFFTAMTVAPVVSIASIGTQISEAFAGLDRIRELKQMATEDQEDASRPPCRNSRATSGSRTWVSSTTRASPCSRACRSTRRPGRRRRWSDRAGPARAPSSRSS